MPDFTSLLNNFFKADDLKDGPRTMTIKEVKASLLGPEGEQEKKPVMLFNEDERGVTLNKSRYEAATAFFGGANTDLWIGKRISLVYDPNVQFKGKRVGGIVFRLPT